MRYKGDCGNIWKTLSRVQFALVFLWGMPALRSESPSHLMVGPGIFNVDKSHPRFMYQIEFRWEPHCHHIRPLIAYFANTDHSFYICGGMGYDWFIGKRFVVTPSFAPGWYYQGNGRRLGFPVNFRSGIEAAVIVHNQGRIGAQFSHISNARMLVRNPGADSLVLYYAIPFPLKKKSQSSPKEN